MPVPTPVTPGSEPAGTVSCRPASCSTSSGAGQGRSSGPSTAVTGTGAVGTASRVREKRRRRDLFYAVHDDVGGAVSQLGVSAGFREAEDRRHAGDHTTVDQAGIAGQAVRRPDPQPLRDPGAESLQQDVDLGDQFEQPRGLCRVLEVELQSWPGGGAAPGRGRWSLRLSRSCPAGRSEPRRHRGPPASSRRAGRDRSRRARSRGSREADRMRQPTIPRPCLY